MVFRQDITAVFKEHAARDSNVQTAYHLVRQWTQGKMWLCGGAVYEPIISRIHGREIKVKDYDFIVEKISIPPSAGHTISRLGSPKIMLGNMVIDVVPLNNVIYINEYGLEHTIENYLQYTLLDIQSICYDFEKRQIIGEKGIAAIQKQEVCINDRRQALRFEGIYKKSIEEYAIEKADKIGFRAKL